jgi:hypothetical protein
MDTRRIYLSHAVEDAERVRPLRVLLESLGMTVVTSWPEVIGSASNFVACLSADADGTTKYNRAEVEAAIELGPKMPLQWLVLVQLTPCMLPQLPGIARNAPLVQWQGRSPEPAASGAATFTLKAREMAGERASFTNVDGALPANTSARTEITADTFVTDGAMSFTNVTGKRR